MNIITVETYKSVIIDSNNVEKAIKHFENISDKNIMTIVREKKMKSIKELAALGSRLSHEMIQRAITGDFTMSEDFSNKSMAKLRKELSELSRDELIDHLAFQYVIQTKNLISGGRNGGKRD